VATPEEEAALALESAKGSKLIESTFDVGLGNEIVTPVQQYSLKPTVQPVIDVKNFLAPPNKTLVGIFFDGVLTASSASTTFLSMPVLPEQWQIVSPFCTSMRFKDNTLIGNDAFIRTEVSFQGVPWFRFKHQMGPENFPNRSVSNLVIPRFLIPPGAKGFVFFEADVNPPAEMQFSVGGSIVALKPGVIPSF